jgi:NAD-dependent SIR2 family protein deacetylase
MLDLFKRLVKKQRCILCPPSASVAVLFRFLPGAPFQCPTEEQEIRSRVANFGEKPPQQQF